MDRLRSNQTDKAGLMKRIEGKTPYELIPAEAMEEFARAMEHGAQKHERDDWRKGHGMPWSWLIAAALRHSWCMIRGEMIDSESGLHHGAHLMCCGAMLIYYYKYRDRYSLNDTFVQEDK